MATKRETPSNKPAKRKTATPIPEPTDNAGIGGQEAVQSPTRASATIDSDTRLHLVAAEAYFLAERRGFTAGYELEDWVAAEVLVDLRLQQPQSV